MNYVGSRILHGDGDGRGRMSEQPSGMKHGALRGCNALLMCIEEDCDIPGMRVDVSEEDTSADLNGLFTNTGIRGMLAGKDYRNGDSLFSFVAAFIDRATGFVRNAPMTRVLFRYSMLLKMVMNRDEWYGLRAENVAEMKRDVAELKRVTVGTVGEHCNTGLFTMKIPLT